MPYTLADARTRIASDLLDDPSNTRWDEDALDRALKVALARVLSDYTLEGGDRFLEEATGLSPTGASLDLSTQDPVALSTVFAVANNTRYRLRQVTPGERAQRASSFPYTVDVLYLPRFAFPAQTTDYIIGGGATAKNTTDIIDDLVCHEAARLLWSRESETPPSHLERMRVELHDSVKGEGQQPRFFVMPRTKRVAPPFVFSWLASAQTLTFSLEWP